MSRSNRTNYKDVKYIIKWNVQINDELTDIKNCSEILSKMSKTPNHMLSVWDRE